MEIAFAHYLVIIKFNKDSMCDLVVMKTGA